MDVEYTEKGGRDVRVPSVKKNIIVLVELIKNIIFVFLKSFIIVHFRKMETGL